MERTPGAVRYAAYLHRRWLWRCQMNLVLDGIAEATDRAERETLEGIIAATERADEHAGEPNTERAPGEEPRA